MSWWIRQPGDLFIRNGCLNIVQALDGVHIPATPAPLAKARRFRLGDARGVRRELAALYSEFRNGKIDSDVARTGAFVLRCVLESIRTDEIEQRLNILEQQK
jgi:hypothetical protein